MVNIFFVRWYFVVETKSVFWGYPSKHCNYPSPQAIKYGENQVAGLIPSQVLEERSVNTIVSMICADYCIHFLFMNILPVDERRSILWMEE